MTDTDRDEMMLDALFDVAKTDASAAPSSDFLARVLADAEAMQPDPTTQIADRTEDKPGLWNVLLKALGGWPSVAGLATAAAAGVWIGVVGSTSLMADGIGATLLSNGQDSFLSDLDANYAFLVE
ncbi:hypothetical protein [Shimia sp.]|uniref:hypothetical protein n=1 Tax=Shimia sp. TaxID=1954381 RepID=UPI00329830B3